MRIVHADRPCSWRERRASCLPAGVFERAPFRRRPCRLPATLEVTQGGDSSQKLQARQPRVQAALRQQRFVRPLFRDTPVIQHHDPVGLLHRGQAMGDD